MGILQFYQWSLCGLLKGLLQVKYTFEVLPLVANHLFFIFFTSVKKRMDTFNTVNEKYLENYEYYCILLGLLNSPHSDFWAMGCSEYVSHIILVHSNFVVECFYQNNFSHFSGSIFCTFLLEQIVN